MSKRSLSTFANNCENYANSDNYSSCEVRKEILNSVNRSNVNHTIILNYGEEEEGFTSLLHVALCFGDRLMCQRILSIDQVNLKITDSNGEDVMAFVERLKQEKCENKASALFLDFIDEKNGVIKKKDSKKRENLFSKINKLINKFY